MNRSNRRQPNPRISDDALVEIVLQRYAGGRVLTINELAARVQRNRVVVSRWHDRAFREGLVRVCKTTHRQHRRVQSLEEELKSRYRLAAAVVVDMPSTASSDDVHQALGRVASQLEILAIRAREVIGVGPGRGIHHLIAGLIEHGPISAEQVKAVSLCGTLFAGGVAQSWNLCVDADVNVASLGPAFESPVDAEPVSYPLLQRRAADAPPWAGVQLTQTWCGLGIVQESRDGLRGHRLWELASQEESALGVPSTLRRTLDSIRRMLHQIAECAGEVPYAPVAEVAYHFFLVPPPANLHERIPTHLLHALDRALMRLTSSIATAPGRLLREAQLAVLVAGTASKADAIRHSLESGVPAKFHVVITDRTAAGRILRRPDS